MCTVSGVLFSDSYAKSLKFDVLLVEVNVARMTVSHCWLWVGVLKVGN